MNRALSALPFFWGSIGAAGTVTESTGISLSLFITGIIGTVVLVWRLRGDRDKLYSAIHSVDVKVDKIDRKLDRHVETTESES
jgi:hypothetical protein